MTFWTGSEWIPETPPTPAGGPASRAVTWAATLIMVASVALYAVPFAATTAAGPTLVLSPSSGAPGTKVVATGQGFSSKIQVQLTWDGVTAGMPTVSTNGHGSLRATFKVPKATMGPHTSGVEQVLSTTPGTNQVSDTSSDSSLATAEFDVTAIASPTPGPTSTATPRPTPTPMPVTTPTPMPVTTPTPMPVTTPTPMPVTTPTPTPITTPTPTLAATPVPPVRPFPPPVTTQTLSVPSSIDATGASDASGALNAFVASVPDGSVIAFKAGGTYRLDHGIKFGYNATVARHNLVFEGNGATLRPTATVDSTSNSVFALWGTAGAAANNSDIVIRNFNIIGTNTTTGYHSGASENRHGVLVSGGSRIEIANVTMLNTWSDYVEIDQGADNVWVHDNSLTHSGRMGISPVKATHVLIERNTFDLTTWVTLDCEPNVLADEVGWITFRDNSIKRPGTFGVELAEANGGVDTPNVHDITVTNNTTEGTLDSAITHISRRRNITFTNNVASTSAAGPVLHFAHIDGLTVTGNIQPLSSGVLASITDSTSVIYR